MRTKQNLSKPANSVCIGTGLVALDVIISGDSAVPTQFLAGGSCGNVLTILSYLGWNCYPIARLSDNKTSAELLLQDLHKWNVKDDLLSFTKDGSTPIIIHRILKDKNGIPKHRFEFRNPEDGAYLPSYKPCLAKSVNDIVSKSLAPRVFYFDRINRASIDLAKAYKKEGAIIFFEPSSIKDLKGFNECLDIADIVKFSEDRIPNFDHLYPSCKSSLEIQTLGEKGLKFRRKNSAIWSHLSGYTIDNVVDSAGAGDWCSAGIIMTLFKEDKDFDDLQQADFAFALQFGQALSALNCTFEGARGLMYNIKRNELLLSIQHIISSKLEKIPQKNRPINNYRNDTKQLKISSLFA